jgi:hypothetical protein
LFRLRCGCIRHQIFDGRQNISAASLCEIARAPAVPYSLRMIRKPVSDALIFSMLMTSFASGVAVFLTPAPLAKDLSDFRRKDHAARSHQARLPCGQGRSAPAMPSVPPRALSPQGSPPEVECAMASASALLQSKVSYPKSLPRRMA